MITAKSEAYKLMVEKAKRGDLIFYSALASSINTIVGINTIKLRANDPRLFTLLEEISREEDIAGRGMLSAVVVHEHHPVQPGKGFFQLAKQLGRKFSDDEKFWSDELKRVYKAHS